MQRSIISWLDRIRSNNTWRRVIVVALVLLAAAAIRDVYLVFFKGYVWPEWTGFGEYIGPPVGDNREFQRAKTLWDLMELLIIPAVLGFGALWFNQAARASEQKIAVDQQKEKALQNYLDKIAELLLKEKLLEKKDNPKDPIVDVAKARTVTTLRILDRDRRNVLFQFLRDANLADFILVSASLAEIDLNNLDMAAINLRQADLTGACLSKANLQRASLDAADLNEADLTRANLFGADLRFASLLKANLHEANLTETKLGGVNLSEANLDGVNLSEADLKAAILIKGSLRGVDLSEAELKEANLKEADLRGAKVSEDQLATVYSLEGATMPDGTVHV